LFKLKLPWSEIGVLRDNWDKYCMFTAMGRCLAEQMFIKWREK